VVKVAGSDCEGFEILLYFGEAKVAT